MTIAVFSGAVLFVYALWYALAPIVARDVYGGAGSSVCSGASPACGAVLGAIVGVRWQPAAAAARRAVAGPGLAGARTACSRSARRLALVVVCAFATGFGFSLLMICWETALARHIPPHALSRVSAYDWMGSLALLPVGLPRRRPAGSAFGARTVLGVGGAIGLVLLLLALLPRSTRELRGTPAAAQPSSPARDVGVEIGSEA